MLEVTIDTRAFDAAIAVLAGFGEELERELWRAAQRVKVQLTGDARNYLTTEIYNVPTPLKKSADKRLSAKAAVRTKTTKGKYGRWMRSRGLMNNENADVTRVSGDVLVRLFNNARYAIHRNSLGTPGHRRSGEQSGNSLTRSVQWQEWAVRDNREFIRAEFSAAIRRAYKRRK